MVGVGPGWALQAVQWPLSRIASSLTVTGMTGVAPDL